MNFAQCWFIFCPFLVHSCSTISPFFVQFWIGCFVHYCQFLIRILSVLGRFLSITDNFLVHFCSLALFQSMRFYLETIQIHSRYNTFLKANFDNWTADEDFQLLSAVKANKSGDWKGVSGSFISRTRSQCRQRFYFIRRYYKKDTERSTHFSLTKIPYDKKESVQKKRQQELYIKLEEKVGEFLRLNKVESNWSS